MGLARFNSLLVRVVAISSRTLRLIEPQQHHGPHCGVVERAPGRVVITASQDGPSKLCICLVCTKTQQDDVLLGILMVCTYIS